MKNITSSVKERLISRYLEKSDTKVKSKSTDINILLKIMELVMISNYPFLEMLQENG